MARNIGRSFILGDKGQVSHQVAIALAEKEYQVFQTKGYSVGKVNGLAVLGDAFSGLVLPIVAEVTPSSSKSGGKIIATGKLGTIAKEAVENVSAIIKKYTHKDLSSKDIHIQFLQTYEGVEGDSASISIAVAVISDLEQIPVDNSYALTGSLSVRGEVLPVGGVTAKVEAAHDAGINKVVIPKANKQDVYLRSELKGKVQILEASNILDVLSLVLKDSPQKKKLLSEIKKQFSQ
jgi:Lon-like ATP-dependent protease